MTDHTDMALQVGGIVYTTPEQRGPAMRALASIAIRKDAVADLYGVLEHLGLVPSGQIRQGITDPNGIRRSRRPR